jgi:lipopolysaccharide export system protein LptA
MNALRADHRALRWWIIRIGIALAILPSLLATPCRTSLAQAQAQAQNAKPAGASPLQSVLTKENPIHISSHKMEVSQKEGTVLFEGHVVAQQDTLTMTGKKLMIYSAKGKAKSPKAAGDKSGVVESLDRIEVNGDVTISQGDKVATCEKAVYYKQDQKIVLSGNPRVAQGKDVLNGSLITLYLLEERSVIEGGSQNPVQATIYPEGKKIP